MLKNGNHMKYYFVLNPTAGGKKLIPQMGEKIKEYCEKKQLDHELHYTDKVGDAEGYTKHICESVSGEKIFFFGGGDGTFSEGVNGAYGYEDVTVGIIPLGSGNDFVRNFTFPEAFLNLSSQMEYKKIKIDLMEYNGRKCVNMLNCGIDCDVASRMADLRDNRMVPVKMRYIYSLVGAFAEMPYSKVEMEFDDGERIDREVQLFCVGNGTSCGGGFKCTPKASLTDGIMDVCVINRVSRLKFLQFVGPYKAGKLADNEKVKDLVTYKKCRSFIVKFKEQTEISVDGEIEKVKKLKVRMLPKAISFAMPAGCEMITVD